LQRFPSPSVTSGSGQFAGDLAVSEPTAVAPEKPTSERVVAGSGDNQSGEDQPGGGEGEPEACKTPADAPPKATTETPATGLRSEASEDAIADVQAVQTASGRPAAEEQPEASDDAMLDAHAVRAVGASPEQSAVESLASERATAVLVSVLDRLGAAHHRPFSRG
jgi:hypothetical protein